MDYQGGRIDYGLMAIVLLASLMPGCGPKKVQLTAAASLGNYVAEAGTQAAPPQSSEGSLWVAQGANANLFRDFKARRVNDIVTIMVSETTSANATADAANSKDSTANIGMNSFFGLEKKIKELPNLVDGKSSTSYKGNGSTTRATTLSTTMTARVKGVLANGYLVIEGVREVRVNNENQTIYLTGIVRPEDISARNVVPSAAIAQMEVRVQGRGVVSQPLKPGLLLRFLNGVFPF
jgi:flagellar L-ring protein precursor FlgH